MSSAAASSYEAKIASMGLTLPPASKPVASYVMSTRVGNLIYTAGHLPVTSDGTVMTGKVGTELTTEQGYEAARNVGLNICATLKSELGDLSRVKRFVKLTAFVNCVDSYQSQPKVVNGCSEFLGAVFGEAGKHARSAVGVNALPLNVPVEIEAVSQTAFCGAGPGRLPCFAHAPPYAALYHPLPCPPHLNRLLRWNERFFLWRKNEKTETRALYKISTPVLAPQVRVVATRQVGQVPPLHQPLCLSVHKSLVGVVLVDLGLVLCSSVCVCVRGSV